MRKDFFFDAHHASQYLRGCVIRYDEAPVFIQDVMAERGQINIYHIGMASGRGHTKKHPIEDPKWNFNPVPLGFTFYPDRGTGFTFSVYCARNPIRNWKVGLCRNNLHAEPVVPRQGVMVSREWLMTSDSLLKTITNKYPTFNEAIETMSADPDTILSVPFSRRFCIMTNGRLRYKTRDVSVGTWSENGPELFNDFSFLNQVLQEDLDRAG